MCSSGPTTVPTQRTAATIVDAAGSAAASELIVEAFWTPPDGDQNVADFTPRGTEGATITFCSDVDEFDSGVGIIASSDLAVRTTYKFRDTRLPYEAARGKTAATALRGLVEGFARSCAGVDIIPRSAYYTPLPVYLAEALEAVRGETLSIEESPAPVSLVTGAPATPEPQTTSPSQPATTGEAGADAGVAGSSTKRLIGFVLLGLSVVGLLWTMSKARKERRVRPKFDIARLAIVTATAIGMMLVLANTPGWAVVGGVSLGLLLGWLQGRHVSVRIAGPRAYERRNALAVFAFAVGLVVAQGAGLLNRTGAIGIGVGVTFLSAATTAGVIAGRAKRLNAARPGAAALLWVGILAAVSFFPFVSGVLAQERAFNEEMRAVLLEDLTQAVEWDKIDIVGGLFPNDLKPLTEVSMSARLREVPDDISHSLEWTVIPPRFDEETQKWVDADPGVWRDYNLTETFTFSLNADGVCCSVGYDGTGTEQIGVGNPALLTASGTLGDFVDIAGRTYSSFFEDGRQEWGLPFGEVQRLATPTQEELCRRPVTDQPRTDYDDWATTFNGADNGGFPGPTFNLYTGCDISGFDVESAQAMLPPVPASRAPERDVLFGSTAGAGCPVFQEAFNALYDPSMGGAPTDQVRRMFLNPNSTACSAPVTIGEEGPGGVRSEVRYAMATPDEEVEARRQYQAAEDLLLKVRPFHEIDVICAFDDRGVPQAPANDGEFCLLRTFHEYGDGTITIWTDYESQDGPNVIVRGFFRWGNYHYRCHHCDASSPEVARIVAAMEVLGNTGLGNFGPDAEVIGSVGAPEGRVGETRGVENIIDPDIIDLLTDDPYEAAVLAGIIAMAGTIGLAGVAAAHGRADRKEGEWQPVVIDEYGRGLEPNEEGLYPWDVDEEDTRWVDREELERLIAESRAAQQSIEDRIRDKLAEDERRRKADLEELSRKGKTGAEAEAAALEAAASHREKIWDWFEAHPEYDHLWERVIRPDGSVDTGLLNRIVRHAQQAGIDPPEISLLEDFMWATATEIFTGREADGSISWESMILRGIIGAATAGQSEWVYTPADALVRMQEAIDSGDTRDWTVIAVETGAWAVFDEIFGRVIGKGLEVGADGLTKLFPELTRDAAEVLAEMMERLRRPVGVRPVGPALDTFKRQIDDAFEAIARGDAGAEQAAREIFADGGMKRMAQLEAAGHISAEQARQIVKLHDRITKEAIESGTRGAISDWGDDLPTIREVYVGNSGSVGPTRSVKTDADRTVVLVFDETQLQNFADSRCIDVDVAHDLLQKQFSDASADRAAQALNAAGGVHLDATADMDMANYAGIGTGSGQADSYPTQYTRSRMSVFGEADVYRVGETGVTRTSTSGEALLDQMALNDARLGRAMPDAQIRIPDTEMTLLHNQQMTVVENATDIKSIAKAVERERKIASQLGQPMPDAQLVEMARQIRAQPTNTNAILASYGFTEQEGIEALRQMMNQYDATIQLPHLP